MNRVEIKAIREELKNFKSTRKATLKLLSLVSNKYIIMVRQIVFCADTWVHSNGKYPMGEGWLLLHEPNSRLLTIHINSNIVQFSLSKDCKNHRLCASCLRETSRCSLIHIRKLLCYKFLLSHKFPKDLIRLIAKKVK